MRSAHPGLASTRLGALTSSTVAVFFFGTVTAQATAVVFPVASGLTSVLAIVSLVAGASAVLSSWFLGRVRLRTSAILALLGIVTLIFLVRSPGLSQTGVRTVILSFVATAVVGLSRDVAFRMGVNAMRYYLAVCALVYATPLRSSLFSGVAARDESFAVLGDSRFQGLLVSPNTNGAVLATLLLAEIVLFRSRSRRGRVVALLSLLLGALALIQSGSVTAIAAAALASLVALVRFLPLARAVAAGVAFVAIAPAVIVLSRGGEPGGRALFAEDFATGRGMIWNQIGRVIASGDWLGLPLGWSIPGEANNALALYGGGHAHNLALQSLLWGGVPFFVLGLLLAAAAYRRAFSSVESLAAFGLLALLSYAEIPFVWLPGSLNGIIIAVGLSLVLGRDEVEHHA